MTGVRALLDVKAKIEGVDTYRERRFEFNFA
jgi:hypothetical protein